MIRYYNYSALILLVLSVLFLGACKKEVKAKTKTEFLTAASWKLNALTVDPAYDYNGDGEPETNLFALFDDCSRDDYEVFQLGGTGSSDAGVLKCDPNDPQTTKLTWSFNEDQTKITIDGIQFTIVELNSIQMKLSSEQTEGDVVYTQTSIYIH